MTPDAMLEKVAALWLEFWLRDDPWNTPDVTVEEAAMQDLKGWLEIMADNGIGWCVVPGDDRG